MRRVEQQATHRGQAPARQMSFESPLAIDSKINERDQEEIVTTAEKERTNHAKANEGRETERDAKANVEWTGEESMAKLHHFTLQRSGSQREAKVPNTRPAHGRKTDQAERPRSSQLNSRHWTTIHTITELDLCILYRTDCSGFQYADLYLSFTSNATCGRQLIRCMGGVETATSQQHDTVIQSRFTFSWMLLPSQRQGF